MRKLALLLALGLFLGATSANACDGGKTASRSHKGKKTCQCSKATAAKSCNKANCSHAKCKSGHCKAHAHRTTAMNG